MQLNPLRWFRRRSLDGPSVAEQAIDLLTPEYLPVIELRAIKPSERGTTGRLLRKWNARIPGAFSAALIAYTTTEAKPGHRLELRLVCQLRQRFQPEVPTLDAETVRKTVAALKDTAPPPPPELIDRDTAEGHDGRGVVAAHVCDSDGKLVDGGRGIYVHTCSQCGAPNHA